MRILTEERLKKKYLEEALELTRSDRSMAASANFNPEEWRVACSAKIETLLEAVLDIVNISIEEEEEAEEERAKNPQPKGQYKGLAVDGTVINGDYVGG